MENHNRPKISIYIATSIDGFIAKTDGSLDWLEIVGCNCEDYGFKKFLSSVDAVILGRKTYEVAVTAYGTAEWPYHGKRLIVLSNTLHTVIAEAQLYAGDLITLTKQLHSEGFSHIWIDGGVTISQFLRLNLVDEMILSVIPILLGSGIPLFDKGRVTPCSLISMQCYPSGLAQLHYKLS
jgi:dihydrofolate reductase